MMRSGRWPDARPGGQPRHRAALDPPTPAARFLLRRGPLTSQLVAGAERPTGPSQDDRAHRRIVLAAREGLPQLHASLMVDGVELLRSIQRNPRDRPGLLEQNK